jgi:cystathionine beta-synthase (O-acetyl-L-serine)
VEEIPGSFCPQQFSNPANPQTYYKTLGPEIWDQMDEKVNIFVAGAGSGGTFMGTAKF